MPNSERESFIRWQGRLIEQLGFVNNLLLGLATGLLAFQTQLAFDNKALLTTAEKCVAVLSIIFVFLSVTFGCYVAYNRLRSFRFTAQIAQREKRENAKGLTS